MDIQPVINRMRANWKLFLIIGGLVACVYASSGAQRQAIDAVILNSPFLAQLDTSWSDSILGDMLMKFGLSTDVPDKWDLTVYEIHQIIYFLYHCSWYNRSIHSEHRGEWNFDTQKIPIDIVRVHGPSFKAIYSAQEDLKKKGSCIKCPILVLCSSRSIRPEKTWRDEYGEGNWLFFIREK